MEQARFTRFFVRDFMMKVCVKNLEVEILWPQAFEMTIFFSNQQTEGKRCLSFWIVDQKYSFHYLVLDLHSLHVYAENIICCLEYFFQTHCLTHPCFVDT